MCINHLTITSTIMLNVAYIRRLTSGLTGLDSAALVIFNQQQIYFLGKSNTVKQEISP